MGVSMDRWTTLCSQTALSMVSAFEFSLAENKSFKRQIFWFARKSKKVNVSQSGAGNPK